MKADSTAAPAPVANRKLHPNRFQPAENVRMVYAIVPDQGTLYDDLFKPEYWSHIASRLRPGDRIEVTAEDYSYVAVLLVLATARQSARVVELSKTTIEANSVALNDVDAAHKIEHKGPHLKWCVIRLSDGERLKEKLESRQAANEWLSGHVKAMAA